MKNEETFCIVLTTFESEEQADKVSEEIIKNKLAACIQYIPIKSRYFWDGKVCKDSEVLVLFKTRDDLYEDLKEKIVQLHPYDVPEVIKVDISDGTEDYLGWIKEVTQHG